MTRVLQGSIFQCFLTIFSSSGINQNSSTELQYLLIAVVPGLEQRLFSHFHQLCQTAHKQHLESLFRKSVFGRKKGEEVNHYINKKQA